MVGRPSAGRRTRDRIAPVGRECRRRTREWAVGHRELLALNGGRTTVRARTSRDATRFSRPNRTPHSDSTVSQDSRQFVNHMSIYKYRSPGVVSGPLDLISGRTSGTRRRSSLVGKRTLSTTTIGSTRCLWVVEANTPRRFRTNRAAATSLSTAIGERSRAATSRSDASRRRRPRKFRAAVPLLDVRYQVNRLLGNQYPEFCTDVDR